MVNMTSEVVVRLIDTMGNDRAVCQAARVSLQGENEAVDTLRDAGLIDYLLRNKHGSPFEHVTMKFYVKAPIFVFREFMRHRMASYNEMSGRYTKLEPEFYWPDAERNLINIGTSAAPLMGPAPKGVWEEVQNTIHTNSMQAWARYEELLELGIANEVARLVLPVNIMSQMYVTMNARSLMNFLSLRTHRPDAAHVSRPQREIEMVAEKIEVAFMDFIPLVFESFERHGRVAP